ncbi:hypothetical protein PsorP6_011515 [Peronosclerospora sorghi]|uniref:Uncharacterized protein n=1 Tax=Peronosclerospora sorghi TaxID=230839 RepID=A0ACC0WLM3_9STRA|nr:hypothetical protein PsorP6_011515 [Peronosclerospora sorghi]
MHVTPLSICATKETGNSLEATKRLASRQKTMSTLYAASQQHFSWCRIQGLHTEERARDTCWLVVPAAIARNRCCEPGLFRKVIVAFKMNTLQEAVRAVESDITQISVNDECVCVDDLFYMLEVSVQSIVELLEGGYDVSILEKKCGVLRSSIDGVVDILNRRTAEKYVMPEYTELLEVSKLGCRISMPSLKTSNDFNGLVSNEQRHRRGLHPNVRTKKS